MDTNPRPESAFSKIGNFFRGNTKINKTLPFKRSGEQDGFSEKAVDALVKKLKPQKDGLARLQHALKTEGQQPSECVTIPRSMDGRIQIANRKELPHVIYSRIWRWADLQNHNELRAIKTCEFPWSAKKASICINPYHYERIVYNNILPPMLVPKYSEFAPGYSLLPGQQMPEQQQTQANVICNNTGFSGPTNGFGTGSVCSSSQNSPMSSVSSWSAGNQQQNFQYPNTNGTPSPTFWQDNNTFMQQQPETVQVHYEEPEMWASIAYYELNHRVGEQFHCHNNSTSCTVDGFTNPNCKYSNRFCLGQLTSIYRNQSIAKCREHIGKGLEINWNNGELFIKCLSGSPIFVQSAMTNHMYRCNSSTAVCKVLPECSLKIFDYNVFRDLLDHVVDKGFEATMALTKMCTIRVSFVKGWGTDYQRQDITSTPCWIELHLNGPLKFLDNILISMGSPLYTITSQS